VEFPLTVDDVWAVSRFCAQSVIRRQTIAFVGLATFGVVLLPFERSTGIGIVFVLMGLFLLGLLHIPTFNQRGARRAMGDLAGTVVRHQLGADGIHSASDLSTGFTPWSTLTGIRMNPDYLVMMRDSRLVSWVPLRAFGTSVERDAWIAFARAHIGRGASA
jgi:hypothetical protein